MIPDVMLSEGFSPSRSIPTPDISGVGFQLAIENLIH